MSRSARTNRATYVMLLVLLRQSDFPTIGLFFMNLKRSLKSPMRFATKILAVLILVLASSCVFAGFEEGEEANRRGERDLAFSHFREAATGGDVRAFTKLGSMYLYGLGTERNFVQAYVWFALGSENGDKYAEAFRKTAAGSMTPEQVTEAEKLLEEKRGSNQAAKAPDQQ
jgi:TPR repeat protein